MTADAPVWLLPEGWSTTHVLRPCVQPPHTLCNRLVGARPLLPEASGHGRCGQCQRRLSTRSRPETSR